MTTRNQSRFSKHWLSIPVIVRLIIAAVIGAAAAYGVGTHFSWAFTPLVFWDVTALVASCGLWLSIRKLDADETKKHATKDDPSRGIADVILTLASFASLAGVLVLAIDAKNAEGVRQAIDVGLGLASVVISWTLVHLLYTLRYADLHFKGNSTGKGAIDFHNDTPPTYQDFAYVSFTIGMTYQVSDTDLTTPEIRKTARHHALISYVFGTAIIATAINTIAGLGK